MKDKDIIICRCEEITKGEIIQAELGHLPPAEEYPSTRPPVRPMPLSALLAGEEDT